MNVTYSVIIRGEAVPLVLTPDGVILPNGDFYAIWDQLPGVEGNSGN